MPKSKRAKASNIKRKKKNILAKKTKMPKAIRDELRLTCALRGFASMRQGFHNTLAEQAKIMYDWFHGVPGQQPSQLKMLAEGTGVYRDLYEATTQRIVTSKKNVVTSHRMMDPSPVYD